MSAVATRPAPLQLPVPEEPRDQPRRPVTLQERLDLILVAVGREGVAECPVCSGQMLGDETSATCRDCGTVLV